MKVKVTLTGTDPETGKMKIIAQGPALFDGKRLLYSEEKTKAKHDIHYDNDVLTITRTGEMTSIIKLNGNGTGTVTIISEFGTMELKAITELLLVRDDLWCVEYRVESGDEPGEKMHMEWHIGQFV